MKTQEANDTIAIRSFLLLSMPRGSCISYRSKYRTNSFTKAVSEDH